jgi:phenylacetate-CoA ligase
VLLEAILAGVPVVTTGVGGIPEVVSDKEAIIVAPEDVAGLAQGVLRLFANSGIATALASAATARAERELNFDRWLDAYECVYTHALAESVDSR